MGVIFRAKAQRSKERKEDWMKREKLILRLGTRASALALTQSRSVARMLERAQPGVKVKLVEISTTGDRVTGKPLASFGGAGVFVKELETALLDGRVDFAVHSLKDLPTKQPRGLVIAAIGKREDARDAVITRGDGKLKDLPGGSVVGSGSTRRRAQLMAQFPKLNFAEIRGNVETRIRKVDEGQYAATILALAGLKRLKLSARANEILPYDVVLPAPGQGALGIECRANDRKTRGLLAALNDPEAAACVEAERALLEALGGGCHLPLGALGEIVNGELRLRAALGHPDGGIVLKAWRSGELKGARAIGKSLARELIKLGGDEIIARLRREGMSGV